MENFSAKRDTLDNQPVVVLAGPAGHRARIACHGAALLGLEIPRGGASFNLAWGYRTAAEIVARAGSHFAIMVPFAGRVADARYRFDGEDHDLKPGSPPGTRDVHHGLVRDADFAVSALEASAASASTVLTTSAIRPRPGYPFSIDLAVRFTLDATGLALEARMRNVGARVAPCFFGWHPYIRIAPGGVDDWVLEIPARTTIRTDVRLIALPGDAAYVALDAEPELDFRQPHPVGNRVLDTSYTDLAADADGRFRTRLTDPEDGFALAVWQERGLMHVYTGDTLAAGARSAVALEPMECMADAFNRPECADRIRLAPGALRVFRCGVAFPER